MVTVTQVVSRFAISRKSYSGSVVVVLCITGRCNEWAIVFRDVACCFTRWITILCL